MCDLDLNVNFAGIDLSNPLIIGSSSLTNSFWKLKELERAGVGAIVTKLVSDAPMPRHHVYDVKAVLMPYGWCVLGDRRMTMEAGVKLIRRAKKELSIPIIANFVGEGADTKSWVRNASKLSDAGADMVELDLHAGVDSRDVVSKWIGLYPELTGEAVKAIKEEVDVPVMVKLLGQTDFLGVLRACEGAGVDAFSGINAMPGIVAPDIWSGSPIYPGVSKQHISGSYMGPALDPMAIRFTALLALATRKPIISGGGISTWENVVERLMLGAVAVQIVSIVYLKGITVIGEFLNGLRAYLEKQGYNKIEDVIGKGLEKVGKWDEAIVDEIAGPEFVDKDGCWPQKLDKSWWTRPEE